MNKRITITISILLLIAGIIIQLLINDSNTNLDVEIIEFFSGIIIGTGIGLPIFLFFENKKKK